MEAVPRLPMLSFDLKPFYPKNAQFGTDLTNLIRRQYQEDPENYLDEIQQLEKLRHQAAKLNKDIDGIAVLKRYFCQLCFLQKRFPTLKEVSANSEISWKDLLSSSTSKKVDYRSELTTTLYNIGVLHTQLGANDDRSASEGLKLACTHFQCAAWAFQHLREITTVGVRPEFDHGFLEFLISTCLAQAQECIAEKSITDNRKPSISAKVVMQICEYYDVAKHALARIIPDDSTLIDYGLKNPAVCMNYLKYKLPYYKSIASLFMGMQAEEDQKMGERIAYFEVAADELKEAYRYAKKIDVFPLNKDLEEAFSFTNDVIEGKRKNAVSENEFVYHEVVPPKDNLSKVRGAPLVKCIGFDINDPEISGQDIFCKLISMKVHQMSSEYSEEKAQLLRRVCSMVEDKDSELNSFVQSFKLDYLNPAEDPNGLPEELVERCAACEAKPTIVQDLINSMNKLADAHHEVEYMMKEVMELIEGEERAEEKYQTVIGTNRPPSIVATDLKCEAKRYQDGLKKATESNESLRNAISAHVNNLRILSLPLEELDKQLPRVSLNYSPEEKTVVKDLQRLVDKVDEMKNQRALLMLQLRESLRNDDITDQLALKDEDKNAMFQREIAKHQNVVTLIEQNLKAQPNILKAMTNSYAAYAPIRKIISETAHQRSVQINALIESFDVSDDVLKKTIKGLEFYRKLDVNVRKLLSRVKGTCKVQEEERHQMYSKAGKKLSKIQYANADRSQYSTTNSLPTSTTPKLRDYMDQKQFSNTSSEASLPYNPYYNAALPGYVANPTHSTPENSSYTSATKSTPADLNQYYSSVARPPPVGSETTALPTTIAEPSNELKSSVSATVANPYGYNYPFYNTPSSTYQSQPLTHATSNVAYTGSQNVNPQSTYPCGSYPVHYSQVSASVPTFHTYNYAQGAYSSRQSSTSVSELNDYAKGFANHPAYAKSPVTGATNTAATSNTATNNTTGAGHVSSTYVSTTPEYTHPQSTTVSGTPSTYQNAATVYAAQGYGTAGNTARQNIYSSMNVPTGYLNSYGSAVASTTTTPYTPYSATNVPVAYSSNSYTNVSHIEDSYSGTSVQPSNTAQYNGQYSTTGYSDQNSPKHAYNQSVTNAYSQNYYTQPANYPANYGTAYEIAYQYGSVIPQQTSVSASTNKGSSTPNIISVDAVTHNISRYTIAGHHNTSNIDSSSMSLEGRSYANQYAAVSETTTPISSKSQYFTSQYGHQYSNAKVSDNVEQPQPLSGANENENRPAQTKRNSMTYMQADSNGKTTSTFTNNNSSSSSTEKKLESNLDLLADIDFDVSDVPLLPLSEAAAANKIIEKLASLNLNSSSIKKEPSATEGKLKIVPPSNLFSDKEYLNKFVQDAEKFEKFVEKLTQKTLNGSVPLDTLWNEYTIDQEKFSKLQSATIAQQYCSKNRSSSSIPFDGSRVILSGLQPDYINASFVKNPNPSVPDLIITQAPLSSTIGDFWNMIWLQEVELVVCLVTEREMSGDIYWPKEKNVKFELEGFVITLHSVNIQSKWIERIISMLKDGTTRIVIHIQLISWQDELCSRIRSPLFEVLDETISFYYAQRNLQSSIVLHCDTGIGRSGLFATLILFICEINYGKGIPDLMAVLKLVSEGRNNLIKDKNYLLLAFQLALAYVQNILIKYGKRTVPEPIKVENIVNAEPVSSPLKKTYSSEFKLVERLFSKEENRKRNIERFSEGGNLESLADSSKTQCDDPLSCIDPLWPLKKEQS